MKRVALIKYGMSLVLVLLSFMMANQPALADSMPSCPTDMALIQGGTFQIGADQFYPEEHSAEDVTVTPFCIGKHEVTNAEFTQFVTATEYVTVAERSLSKDQFPDLTEDERSPGSVVFQTPQPLTNGDIPFLSWWQWVPGASWHHPEGVDSAIAGRENHPVVHIAYDDAVALRRMGRTFVTDRSPMGICSTGWIERQNLCLGQSILA
jgi:formylglycine-generating enzyme required for sulfatase activity